MKLTAFHLPMLISPIGINRAISSKWGSTALSKTQRPSCGIAKRSCEFAQSESSHPQACTTTPENDDIERVNAPEPLLPPGQLKVVVQDTMLANESLSLVYSATRDGFSNDAFFDNQLLLGGVPSLVLGRTELGVLFGGYSSYGFYARDDYREATSPRSMFVFTVDKEQVIFAENTDPVHYDFYDYAIRFGASLLGIPMNPDKHVLKSDMATSSCRLPNGRTSVLGDATLAKLQEVQVWVAEKYVLQEAPKGKRLFGGLFSGLFG